jgi:hypothetical protein
MTGRCRAEFASSEPFFESLAIFFERRFSASMGHDASTFAKETISRTIFLFFEGDGVVFRLARKDQVPIGGTAGDMAPSRTSFL